MYENKFFYQGKPRFTNDPADLVSKSLWKKLDQLDFSTLNFSQKELILYQYASTIRASTYHYTTRKITGHFSYLMPKEILALVQKIITSMGSYEEKKNIAFRLRSLSGSHLYRNLSSNDKKIAKEYIEFLLSWYEQNDGYDLPIPKNFKYEVVDDFPSFKDRIEALYD